MGRGAALTPTIFRAWLAGVIAVASGQFAVAEDGPECFSKYTKFNACEAAREIQSRMAPALPSKISADVTAVNVVVFGPRLTLTALWKLTKADFQDRMSAAGVTMGQMQNRMDQTTTNYVCSTRDLSAFVRLRGEVQYVYRTTDGFQLFAPTVTSCPRPE